LSGKRLPQLLRAVSLCATKLLLCSVDACYPPARMAGAGKKPSSVSEVEAWLIRQFKLKALRAKQAQVIAHLLAGRRVAFVAPTGHGKSLCYQALAASPWSRGVVLIFQPLKALMQEQVERARSIGLRAALVNSDQDDDAQRAVLETAAAGKLDILFLSPERQGNALWLEYVGKMEIKGVVIDEAHCISQWGHDFRPWYRRLVETIMGIGIRTPVLAVTATAPPTVVDDVIGQIGPEDEPVVVERLGSHRSNIELTCWTVEGFAQRIAALLHLARSFGGSPGIAYLLTHDETEMAGGFLQESGVAAAAYHAGMDHDQRRAVLESWQAGKVSVVCATSALGMGLDRSDVRWIAHVGLPDSLLRYVQEIGRAGRDGKLARAIAIHDPETRPVYNAFLRGSSPPPEDFRSVVAALRAGCSTRTAIVLNADIPDNTVQHILDELRHNEWCVRGHDGSRATYAWSGGAHSGIPDGLEEAIAIRERFLEEALAYSTTSACRAVSLAAAMGDDVLPSSCGRCDVCRPFAMPDLATFTTDARAYLARFCPPIPGVKKVSEPGLALSRYGLGRIGEGIKRAKYKGEPVPGDLVDLAMSRIGMATGPYTGVRFDAVVSIPSATSKIVGDFARALATRLRVPWFELTKNRTTEPQKKFRSKQRKVKNIEGAFSLPAGAPKVARVLLIDDVFDSGASFREASRVLQPATVYPLALARAKHRDDT
jgi:ATP-dependent DNA helicase RecQ